VVSFKKTQTCM